MSVERIITRILTEAAPRDIDKNKIYYHGTARTGNAQSIAKKGIDPDFTLLKYNGSLKSALAPVRNKVYITSDIAYAAMYAIGGDLAGSAILQSMLEEDGKFGYIFAFTGASLNDIVPDEDSIGETLYNILKKDRNDRSSEENRIYIMARQELTERQLASVKDGMYNSWAIAGKKLVKVLPDHILYWILDNTRSHIAHDGAINPDYYYRFDKRNTRKLNRDYSNLLDFCTKVTIKK